MLISPKITTGLTDDVCVLVGARCVRGMIHWLVVLSQEQLPLHVEEVIQMELLVYPLFILALVAWYYRKVTR